MSTTSFAQRYSKPLTPESEPEDANKQEMAWQQRGHRAQNGQWMNETQDRPQDNHKRAALGISHAQAPPFPTDLFASLRTRDQYRPAEYDRHQSTSYLSRDQYHSQPHRERERSPHRDYDFGRRGPGEGYQRPHDGEQEHTSAPKAQIKALEEANGSNDGGERRYRGRDYLPRQENYPWLKPAKEYPWHRPADNYPWSKPAAYSTNQYNPAHPYPTASQSQRWQNNGAAAGYVQPQQYHQQAAYMQTAPGQPWLTQPHYPASGQAYQQFETRYNQSVSTFVPQAQPAGPSTYPDAAVQPYGQQQTANAPFANTQAFQGGSGLPHKPAPFEQNRQGKPSQSKVDMYKNMGLKSLASKERKKTDKFSKKTAQPFAQLASFGQSDFYHQLHQQSGQQHGSFARARTPQSPSKTSRQKKQFLLPRPWPTPAYLAQASSPPQKLQAPRKLIIILDLNGTLLYRRNTGSAFLNRPHNKDFLQYLLANHEVMVWSSARPDNVNGMCNQLFTPQEKASLVGVWDRSNLRLSQEHYNMRVQVYKQLSWVWGDGAVQASYEAGQGWWDQSNTVLIDDSLEKAASEPFNLVQVSEFEGTDEHKAMDVLGQVVRYLEEVKWYQDVSSRMKQSPFIFNATAQPYDWDKAAEQWAF